MKKYHWLLVGTVLFYLAAAVFLGVLSAKADQRREVEYKVEINDLLYQLQEGTPISELPLDSCTYVKAVCFLPGTAQEEEIREFYTESESQHSAVKPLFIQKEWKGYLRFDYVSASGGKERLLYQGILFLFFAFVMAVLHYVRRRVLLPFCKIQELPYELANGHLQEEIPENKERYFGKFLWGLSMLQDSLRHARERELLLTKEKKTLILSLSHDIKIPLSAIKLYARGIYEEVMESREEQISYGHRIEQHADEIEEFVKKIMDASSEEVLSFEVEEGEFYLKDYVNRIKEIYTEKCAIRRVDFRVGEYQNCLLKGDMQRAIEVMENLMDNALKYGDGESIFLSFYEEEYCHVIEVFNTGEGVAKKELPHLFDSFFRGTNAEGKKGSGLGLYIGRQLMLKMGGDLYVQHREGGVSFCMVFE